MHTDSGSAENFASKVRRVFVEAVYLPEKDRKSYLDKACKNDPELHKEVLSLLEADGPLDVDEHSMAHLLHSFEVDDLNNEVIAGELLGENSFSVYNPGENR